MYDPFKHMRKRSQKTLQRAVTSVFDAVLTPASKPVKRRPVARKTPATSRSKGVMPRGAAFTDATHESGFGARSYKLYLPKGAKTAVNPLPLIVMLHGCGQTSQDFARGTGMNVLAEEFGFLVLYPSQSRDAHLMRCWNWYQRGDQARGAGEPALIASMTRDIMASHNVDPAKVYVAGLSAGAAAALVVALAYPDIFAAVGVHSGLPRGAATDAGSVPAAMQNGDPGLRQSVKMPTIIFHGDVDKVIHPRNGRYVAIRALEPFGDLDKNEKTGQSAGGRKYERTQHSIGKGRPYVAHWVIYGSGHAWAGGNPVGGYTDPAGPDASREMVRFFLRHRTSKARRAGRGL